MSVVQEPEVFEVLRKIRYDLTAAQAKVTDALRLLGSMPIAQLPKAVCHCGVACEGPLALAEHRYQVHGEGELCLDCGRVLSADHACAAGVT